jgi:hypothetical protein
MCSLLEGRSSDGIDDVCPRYEFYCDSSGLHFRAAHASGCQGYPRLCLAHNKNVFPKIASITRLTPNSSTQEMVRRNSSSSTYNRRSFTITFHWTSGSPSRTTKTQTPSQYSYHLPPKTHFNLSVVGSDCSSTMDTVVDESGVL